MPTLVRSLRRAALAASIALVSIGAVVVGGRGARALGFDGDSCACANCSCGTPCPCSAP